MDSGKWIGIIGALIGVAGVVIAIILHKRSQRRPVLCYAIDHEILISPEASLIEDGLAVSFNGDPVEMVARSRIAIWSDRGIVRGSEIARTDPLHIPTTKGSLLVHRTLSASRDQIGLSTMDTEFSLMPKRETDSLKEGNGGRMGLSDASPPAGILVNFEFLEKGDGFVLELITTERAAPCLAGTVIGVDLEESHSSDIDATIGRFRNPQMISQRTFKRLILLAIVAVLMLLIAFVFLLVVLFGMDRDKPLPNWFFPAFLLYIAGTALVSMAFDRASRLLKRAASSLRGD